MQLRVSLFGASKCGEGHASETRKQTNRVELHESLLKVHSVLPTHEGHCTVESSINHQKTIYLLDTPVLIKVLNEVDTTLVSVIRLAARLLQARSAGAGAGCRDGTVPGARHLACLVKISTLRRPLQVQLQLLSLTAQVMTD